MSTIGSPLAAGPDGITLSIKCEQLVHTLQYTSYGPYAVMHEARSAAIYSDDYGPAAGPNDTKRCAHIPRLTLGALVPLARRIHHREHA